MISIFSQLIHDAIRLLDRDLHLVVLIRHLLHLLHRLLQILLQVLILALQVGSHVFGMLGIRGIWRS